MSRWFRFQIGFPNTRLISPNAKRRLHWSKYRPAIKAAREEAWAVCREAIGRARFDPEKPVPIIIAISPPDKRRRDQDNIEASLKHALDGISDAIGVDDAMFRVEVNHYAPRPPSGLVEIQIKGGD